MSRHLKIKLSTFFTKIGLCLLLCVGLVAEAQDRLVFTQGHLSEVKLDVGAWPPYIIDGNQHPGAVTLVVNQAFDAIKVKTSTYIKPWPRVEYDIDHSHAISYGWIKNKKRLKKWRYSMPITTGESGFYYRKSDPVKWKTYEDLKPYTIATARGYSYGDDFDRAKTQLKIFENIDELNSLKMLVKDRVNLVVIDRLVGKHLLDSHFSPDERNQLAYDSNHPVKEYRLFLVCAKDWPDCANVIKHFNQGLKTLGRDHINTIMGRPGS